MDKLGIDPKELYPDGKWQGLYGLFSSDTSWPANKLFYLVSVYTKSNKKIVYIHYNALIDERRAIPLAEAIWFYQGWIRRMRDREQFWTIKTVFLSDNIGKELRNTIALEML